MMMRARPGASGVFVQRFTAPSVGLWRATSLRFFTAGRK